MASKSKRKASSSSASRRSSARTTTHFSLTVTLTLLPRQLRALGFWKLPAGPVGPARTVHHNASQPLRRDQNRIQVRKRRLHLRGGLLHYETALRLGVGAAAQECRAPQVRKSFLHRVPRQQVRAARARHHPALQFEESPKCGGDGAKVCLPVGLYSHPREALLARGAAGLSIFVCRASLQLHARAGVGPVGARF